MNRVGAWIGGQTVGRHRHDDQAADLPMTRKPAARVHRASFDERLPWLSGLHTPEEDRAFYTHVVFDQCEVWGVLRGRRPHRRHRSPGELDPNSSMSCRNIRDAASEVPVLALAQARFPSLQLWTFQKNTAARRFYEGRGFVAAEETDGSRNEEREPDIRYVWQRE